MVGGCTDLKYNGKYFDQLPKIKELEKRLDFLEKIIIVDFLKVGVSLDGLKKAVHWNDFLIPNAKPEYKKVSFGSPLYIMYSRNNRKT